MLPEKPPGGPELAREIPDAPLTTILPVQEDGLKAPPAADIEKQAPTEVRPNEGEVQVEDNRDPYLVTYDGPDDPANPFNWGFWRKWAMTVLTSFSALNMLMSSTMLASALTSIGHDLHIGDAETQLAMSIFVLGFALGPMFFSPLTEVYGRKPIWLLGGSWFLVWNTACGFTRNKSLMIACRFLAGFGGSVDFSIANPVMSDLWKPERRGRSLAISTFIPLLGPAIGPILGGDITQRIGWKWLFWTMSIYDATVLTIALLVFKETYAPIILQRKAKRLRKAHPSRPYHTEYELQQRDSNKITTKIRISLTRPIRMLALEPTIQIMSVALAINFSTLYIVLSTFAEMWTSVYDQSISRSGYNYISLVIGYTLASQIGGPLIDILYHYMHSRTGTVRPEDRMPLLVPSYILQPLGLLLYGWSAHSRLPWPVPNLGALIFGAGTILSTQSLMAYILDVYGSRYSASATAASGLPRCLCAFGFPAFAPAMYHALGWGWGNTILAFGVVAGGGVTGIVIWNWGPVLRKKGRVTH